MHSVVDSIVQEHMIQVTHPPAPWFNDEIRSLQTRRDRHIKSNDLLDPYQTGFQEERNTQTAIIRLFDNIRLGINDKLITIAVSFDFSKAFNCVDYLLFLLKLKDLNCSSDVIKWFYSYLTERYDTLPWHQQVVLISNQAMSCLARLKMNNQVFNTTMLRRLVATLILPIFDTCSAIRDLGWLTLQNKRDFLMAYIVYKILRLQHDKILKTNFKYSHFLEYRRGERLKPIDTLSRAQVLSITDTFAALIREKQLTNEKILTIRTQNNNPTKITQVVVIKRAYDNGHFGVTKMVKAIEDEFFIPRLEDKVRRYVDYCIPCLLAEKTRGKKEGMLMPI
ncbi:hypothetical protein M0804_015568 [Polistes exclamans]|nr:hypothetical protein M0804_015568 [Polistes exclamans]